MSSFPPNANQRGPAPQQSRQSRLPSTSSSHSHANILNGETTRSGYSLNGESSRVPSSSMGGGASGSGSGFKSMRSKARGVFGKMFGSSNASRSDLASLAATLSVGNSMSTTQLSKSVSNARPPTIQARKSSVNYPSLRKVERSTSNASTQSPERKSLATDTATIKGEDRASSDVNRVQEEMDHSRPIEGPSRAPLHDDLFSPSTSAPSRTNGHDPIANSGGLAGQTGFAPQSSDFPQDTIKARSRHIRQPATVDGMEDDSQVFMSRSETQTSRDSVLSDSTPVKQMREWTRSMTGLLDGDGIEQHLPLEIGLPASGLQLPEDRAASRASSRIGQDDDLNNILRNSYQLDVRTPRGSPTPRRIATPLQADNDPELETRASSLAQQFFDGDETQYEREKMAEFMGGIRPQSKLTLVKYMEHFDFTKKPLVDSFRELCQKLYLKAETQEIDRILDAFSARFLSCNPGTIFGSSAIVHVVTGSFLLLNTDLHIADISTHMSRAQFVRLTMDTISAHTPEGNAQEHSSAGTSASGSTSTLLPPGQPAGRSVSMYETESSSSIVRPRLGPSASMGNLYSRGWETEMEIILKDIYNAVKSQQILLPLTAGFDSLPITPSSTSLASSMRRHTSMRSMNSAQEQSQAAKRSSVRGYQGLLNGQMGLADGRASPSPSQFSSNDPGPALGFVSNLAHTVIKEQEDETASIGSDGSDSSVDEFDDDELALLGAPWAKEGILTSRAWTDNSAKRSKDKEWKQHFVVIQKGDLHMFVFGDRSTVHANSSSGGVGGGNWMSSAKATGEMNLSHATAQALPPPGYSSSRPYCFSLTLPSGESSFFQAGTEELVAEWVSTCNYWAARRSRPPLPGGVTNAEYGWGPLQSMLNGGEEEILRPAMSFDNRSMISNRSNHSRLSLNPLRRPSHQSSSLSMRLADWKRPQASLIPSPLDEESQLESLEQHLKKLHSELDEHMRLDSLIAQYYPRSSPAYAKTRSNFLARKEYLHLEIVKYEVYVDALKSAISLRIVKQGERKLEKSLSRGLPSRPSQRRRLQQRDGEEIE